MSRRQKVEQRETVKHLEGRELELVVRAGREALQMKEKLNQAATQSIAAQQNFNSMLELAVGQDPDGLTVDFDTGEVHREAKET